MRTYRRDLFTDERHTVLSVDELNEANVVGTLRDAAAKRRGARDTAGFNGGRATHQRGARCELAAAKILGLPWNVPYSKDFHRINASADVGGYEIRSTELLGGHLVVRPKDRDESIFLLAIEERHPMPGWTTVRVTLRGWAFGGDAKLDAYVRNPNQHRAAWFFPQRHLRPIGELPHKARAVMG